MARYDEYRRTRDSDLLRPFESRPDYVAGLYEPDDWAWRGQAPSYE